MCGKFGSLSQQSVNVTLEWSGNLQPGLQVWVAVLTTTLKTAQKTRLEENESYELTSLSISVHFQL